MPCCFLRRGTTRGVSPPACRSTSTVPERTVPAPAVSSVRNPEVSLVNVCVPPGSAIAGVLDRQCRLFPRRKGRARRYPGCAARPSVGVIAAGLAQTSPGTDPVWTSGTRRRYTRLLDTDLYDAWLIEWSPISGVELHDHGGSHGAVVVAAGTLVETYTDLRGRHPLYTRLVTGPQTFTVPATRVHELSNPGPAEARSVHVYSPPLREMTFYDHRPGNFLTPLYTSQGDLAVLEEAAT